MCSGTNLTFPINNVSGNSPGTEYVITYGDGNGTSFPHPPPASVTYGYPTTNCPGAPYIFRIDAITPCPITSFATAALINEINRLGVNVNQLARAVHSDRTSPMDWRDLAAECERVLAKVSAAYGP